MTTEHERHEQHHVGLARMQERIDRIWQSSYERAKRLHVHAPRQFADRSTRSQRVSQNAAWRAHLYSAHGVKQLLPFATLAELQQRHNELHQEVS